MKRLSVLVAAAIVLAGCTDVPSGGSPQTIGPAAEGVGSSDAPSGPYPSSARDVVSAFIAANGTGSITASKRYLTPELQRSWHPTATTILRDISIGTYRTGHPITVFGRQVGSLDASGAFLPNLHGTGASQPVQPPAYRIKFVDGAYKISSLPPRNVGLVVSEEQFTSNFSPRTLYFYDLANRYLIPDLRYSAISDPNRLATWLVSQLITGPQANVASAVGTAGLPIGTVSRPAAVHIGSLVDVDIPGAAQLGSTERDRLAAQISETLAGALASAPITISDDHRPIDIPAANGTQFTSSLFDDSVEPPEPAPEIYYLRNGAVVDSSGTPLSGSGVNGVRELLVSVALTEPAEAGATQDLSVAATAVLGKDLRLYVGTQLAPLVKTSVHGNLSRPAWAPDRNEVWIGDGTKLLRVVVDDTGIHVDPVTLPLQVQGERVLAVRLSSEGSRIALVMRGESDQVWVGPIVRTSRSVSIDGKLAAISPVGVDVTDVAWNDPVKLFAVGAIKRGDEPRQFEMYVDGSGWTMRQTTGMPPDTPDSIAAATGALAWASVDGTVWRQPNSFQWSSPGTGQTKGTAPVYLE